MIFTNILGVGILLSIFGLVLIFWGLVVEKSITLTRDAIDLRPIKIIRSTKLVGLILIKNVFDSRRENVSFTSMIELLLSFILFSLMILLLPYNNQVLIDYIGLGPLDGQLNHSILIKLILVLTLINEFSLINNLLEIDIYKNISSNLNKLIIILFNLFIIKDINHINTAMAMELPGVLLSFMIIVFFMQPEKHYPNKKILINKSKKVLTEITWILFILFYFFNFTAWNDDPAILLLLLILLTSLLIWLVRIFESVSAKIVDEKIELKLIGLAVKVSFLNYIGIKLYDLI